MKYQLEQSVCDEAARLFAGDDLAFVLDKLEATKLVWEQAAPPPRVHIAVLWQSRGNLEEFKRAISQAQSDWRNTLMWNGLGNEDWLQVLADRGIDCSQW